MAGSSSGDSAQQLHAQTAVSATSSVLSIIGAFYILGRYWYARHLKKQSLSVYAASAHHLDVTKELIHVLAYLDLFGAFGRAFGVLPTQTFDQNAGEAVTGVCKLQAFVVTFGDGGPIAWNFVMALNLYRWVCLGEDQQMLMRKIKWYILGTLAFTLAIPTICLSMGKFGDAGLWCWVVVPGNPTEEAWWMLGTLYFWVIAGGITMSVFLILVKVDMQRRLKTYENEDANEAYYAVVHNLTVYITGFIICWLPAVVDRAYKTITGDSSFVLDMLHATIVPLQGFINAVIYGKFHVWVVRHVRQPWSATARGYSANSSKQSELLRLSSRVQERERHQLGTASIFITTFDMNWSACPPNLEDWIPVKKDLYVFSLQHCSNVQEVEQTIRRYLLRVNYPTAYRSITSIAGTAYRGQVQDASVCQMIFVNNADDSSGNFQFNAADGRMWAKRKVFSDVVGIPIRYFDASIAFVTCNLSTILSNTSQRLYQPQESSVLAKHSLTSSLIQSFGMDVDRAAIDFPNLYHHTFLSGNLNYDVEMPKTSLTTSIDQALKAESLKRSTDAAIQSKIKALRALNQEEKSSKHHILQLNNNHGNVEIDWDLLFVKSRNSLGRGSEDGASSDEQLEKKKQVVYEEVLSACDDGLPFTLLRSPAKEMASSGEMSPDDLLTPEPDVAPAVSISIQEKRQVRWEDEGEKRASSSFGWSSFLESLFPSETVVSEQHASESLSSFHSGRGGRGWSEKALGNAGRGLSTRSESKKVTDLLDKYQLASENASRKWQELLRFDQLRAALEAKEVFCGFEEPPIQFLPTYPRKIGASATFSMVSERSSRELFQDTNLEHSLPYVAPAYKDRILAHSLQDTKQRMRNVGYWLCEEVSTSTHKPVCSEYELEIDRFFAYNTEEAALADMRQGNRALRDKRDVREFRIKLVKLDATIWTYEEQEGSTSSHSGQYARLRGQNGGGSNTSSWGTGGQSSGNDSGTSSNATESSSRPSMRRQSVKRRSISQFVGRVLGKDRARSTSSTSSRMATPNPYSEFTSEAAGSHSVTMGSGRLGQRLDLVPVEPVSISTIFPLPSEDAYALQRKVYEVAHFVQNGFQSSARVDDDEEAQLAYTNFRTVAWEEAAKHGVTHSAITKAVSGVVHIAISIKGEKETGGQGVLCLQESELLLHASPVIGEAEPIPFDVPLTWGGKHVGYLHGDVLCAL